MQSDNSALGWVVAESKYHNFLFLIRVDFQCQGLLSTLFHTHWMSFVNHTRMQHFMTLTIYYWWSIFDFQCQRLKLLFDSSSVNCSLFEQCLGFCALKDCFCVTKHTQAVWRNSYTVILLQKVLFWSLHSSVPDIALTFVCKHFYLFRCLAVQ